MSEEPATSRPNVTATNITGQPINFTTDTSAAGTALTAGFDSGNYLFDGATGTTDLTFSTTAWTQPPVPEYKGGNQFYAEWSKWRSEFIRELLREKPIGIVDYKQERFYDTKTNTMRVKVTLEYIPEIHKPGVRK